MTKVGGKWAKQRDPNPETDCQLHSLSPTHSLSVCTLSTHTHSHMFTCSLAHLSSLRCCVPFLTIFAIMRQFLFSVLFNVFFFCFTFSTCCTLYCFCFCSFHTLKVRSAHLPLCLFLSPSSSLSFCRVFSPTHSVYFYQLLQASQIDSAAR